MLLARLADREARCNRCGTRREDWLNADGERLPEPRYRVVLDNCVGCTESHRVMDGRMSGDRDPGDRPRMILNPNHR